MMAQRRAPSIETTAAAESTGGPNPIVGLRRADLRGSVRSVAAEALRNRRHITLSLLRLAGAIVGILPGRMIHRPGVKDHRFAAGAWSDDLLCRLPPRLYLAAHVERNGWPAGSEPDAARLPAAPHGQLIDIYRDNTLARPGAVVDGTPIDLGKICCDAFVTAGTADRIACHRCVARLGYWPASRGTSARRGSPRSARGSTVAASPAVPSWSPGSPAPPGRSVR